MLRCFALQAKASKEILLKQLIELSDQLARSRTDSERVEAKLAAMQVAAWGVAAQHSHSIPCMRVCATA